MFGLAAVGVFLLLEKVGASTWIVPVTLIPHKYQVQKGTAESSVWSALLTIKTSDSLHGGLFIDRRVVLLSTPLETIIRRRIYVG